MTKIRLNRIFISIPFIILLNVILQIYSLIYINFSDDKGFNQECNTKIIECTTAKVFGWLSVFVSIFCFLLFSIFFICFIDSGLSKICKHHLVIFHNSLLILLPLLIIFQAISFSTEIITNDLNKLQEGFVIYIVCMILTLIAFILHPSVNKQPLFLTK